MCTKLRVWPPKGSPLPTQFKPPGSPIPTSMPLGANAFPPEGLANPSHRPAIRSAYLNQEKPPRQIGHCPFAFDELLSASFGRTRRFLPPRDGLCLREQFGLSPQPATSTADRFFRSASEPISDPTSNNERPWIPRLTVSEFLLLGVRFLPRGSSSHDEPR